MFPQKPMFNQIQDEEGANFKEAKPEYYIHLAIIKCQAALQNPDTNQGVPAYSFYVQHIETLCWAAKLIPIDYDTNVKTNLDMLDKQMLTPKERLIMDANYRLKLLLRRIFSNRTIEKPLRDVGSRALAQQKQEGKLPPITQMLYTEPEIELDKNVDDWEDDPDDIPEAEPDETKPPELPL
jgi:hypothetical protein